jgi:DNA-binding transcriptional LysR family regulator
MQRQDLSDMLLFMTVAEEHSFTKAAARLGMTQSTLSYNIKQLESRLGLRLLNRTTRNVSPTEAGERLLASLTPRIQDIETDVEDLMKIRDRPSGTVRINASEHALTTVVWPKLRAVIAEYPDINLELFADSSFSNIVAQRFDAGVRLGESLDQDMIAVRIGPDWRMVAVASPEYLIKKPMPVTPQDLVDHACINTRREAGGLYAWEFEKDGRELRVRVSGQLTFNGSAQMIDSALNHLGIAFMPEDTVIDHIRAGTLVLVLDDWCPKFTGYHLYYPSKRQNSRAFAVILEALRKPLETGACSPAGAH